MTRAARKRLGLRRSLGLWLTPAGEVAAAALVMGAFGLLALLVGVLVQP